MRRAFNQALRELKADRRKLAAVAMLMALGLLLWGRLLLKDVPKTAVAGPGAQAAAAVDEGVIEVESGSLVPRPVIYLDLPAALQRDLFATDLRLYGERNLGGGGKSGPFLSDSAERASALARAGRLKLDSTLLGPRPRAVINGQVTGPGQVVDGWELLEVAQRHVLLRSHGIVIRLRM